MLGRITKRNVALVVRRTATGIACGIAVIAVVVFTGALAPHAAFAQAPDLGLTQVGEATGLPTTDIRILIARIIRAFLGLLGLVAVVLIMYAGYLWMTAAGDEDKIATAKKIITNAVIGLAIILTAFAIVQFILRALINATLSPADPRTSTLVQLYGAGSGSYHLGSGIIEYHYPEAGQTDVPRNTKIAITFKKPLLLSTIIEGYDDKGTYELTDDMVGGVAAVPGTAYPLKKSNIKIIRNTDLGTPTGGSRDEMFDERYPDAALVPVPQSVVVTPVSDAFDPAESQTLVIYFAQPIGSPSSDVNYRVALRGQANGIKVWSEGGDGKPFAEVAFTELNPDGSYFWPFATGTMLDTTPPKISATIPTALQNPSAKPLYRNQIIQVYFDEAVDPTTASGVTGTVAEGGKGFTLLEVLAQCVPNPGNDPDLRCDPKFTTQAPIVGEWRLSNRYRTAEFVPLALCEGIKVNSCGEPVYCLPKNIDLQVTLRASNLAPAPAQPPAGAIPPDGIVDMVNNSMDGNENGTAQGPVQTAFPTPYSLNIPQDDLTSVSDTVLWQARVGDEIDLVPPKVVDIIPKSFGEAAGDPSEATPYAAGPSLVPTDIPVEITWDKTIWTSSLRTGGFPFDTYATVILRSVELVRGAGADCIADASCTPFTALAPIAFFMDSSLVQDADGDDVSTTKIQHRVFLTGNDLGYTKEEILVHPDRVPRYQPILRAKVKDTTQNCFFPSAGFDCSGVDKNDPSCCNRSAQGSFACPL